MKNKNTIQKKDVKRFFLTNLREAAPMLCFIVAYFVSFSILENMTRLHYYVISSPLDHMIPFCEVFVLPYFSWFPYMVIGAGLLLFFDKLSILTPFPGSGPIKGDHSFTEPIMTPFTK